MLRRAGLVAALVALAATGLLQEPAAGGDDTCGPAAARTLRENAYVRVYRARSSEPQPAYACEKRTGERYQLDDPDSDSTAFPAIALNRWYVAYAYNSTDPDYVYTTVAVLDARRFGEGRLKAIVGGSDADERHPAKVGSIVVNSKGNVAWIACSGSATRASARGCERPGPSARVWRAETRTHRRRLLDEGRAIDPASLSLRGFRIRWTNGDERRKAKLE